MREVQSSDAKAHLAQLLTDVERGETIVITRHGRAIARLVPETDQRRADILQAMAELETYRASVPAFAVEDILSARHEGHRH